jgi:plasmid stabilization system protein ParE
MTRIENAPKVFDDFDLSFEYSTQLDVGSAPERIEEILQAVQVLITSPMIGRPARSGKSDLIIGRTRSGYVALYRYVASIDMVFLLTMPAQIRVQKQAMKFGVSFAAATGAKD